MYSERPRSNSRSTRLLHKIDFFILTYGCLAYFTKWLDQANLSNAYVSGMREDLNMRGTDYNLAVTCFQVGKSLTLLHH
jgi:ACS family pantothenate transporter-like MFS transporter